MKDNIIYVVTGFVVVVTQGNLVQAARPSVVQVHQLHPSSAIKRDPGSEQTSPASARFIREPSSTGGGLGQPFKVQNACLPSGLHEQILQSFMKLDPGSQY